MQGLLHWLREALFAAPAVAQQLVHDAPRKALTISPAMLHKLGERKSPNTLVRRELGMPQLPPGVRPAGAAPPPLSIVMDDASGQQFNINSWAWNDGKGAGLYFPGYPYLAELAQRSEYRAPVETTADEMTRRWVELVSKGKGDKSDKISRIGERIEHFKVRELFRRIELLDGFFGRAQLYVDIAGQDTDAIRKCPLLLDNATDIKGKLRGFKVIEPMWSTPVTWEARDPTKDTFYKPDHWYVMGVDTHVTRLLTFVSHEVPDMLKPSYNFGGISLIQLMQPYVDQWLRTRDSVSDMLHTYSIVVLLTDMAAVLQGDDGSDFVERMELFSRFRDNRGTMAIDKNKEDAKIIAAPLGGLHELQAQAQEHMCAPSHIPLVKMTGVTPSGLNASSDGEIQVWYDYIYARQETQYGPHLKTVIDLIQLDEYGSIDEAITARFIKLTEPDGEALARIRKADAETAAVLISSGVIDRVEERERIALDPNSGYDNLDIEALPPDPLDAQVEAETNMAAAANKDPEK